MAANLVRMPFGEWLYRMYEAELPSAARMLAVYAAVFKIANNDELQQLTGVADSTYATHKSKLLKGGWVIISRRAGGRGIGIEVTPAYKETPVKFTDVSPRDPAKFAPVNPPENNPPYEESVTPVISDPLLKITPLNSGVAPEKTPLISDPLSDQGITTRAESLINKPNKLELTNNPCVQDAASTHEEEPTDLVKVNGAAIYGPNFTLDFAAIDMAAALFPMDKTRARTIAEIVARDWACNGHKPANPMAQVRAALRSDFQQGQIQELRVSKASGKAATANGESRDDQRLSMAKQKLQEVTAKRQRGYRQP